MMYPAVEDTINALKFEAVVKQLTRRLRRLMDFAVNIPGVDSAYKRSGYARRLA